MISFVVSAYDRPMHLRCCLASLAIQGEHEIVVLDNGDSRLNRQVCDDMLWRSPVYWRTKYVSTPEYAGICYHPKELVLPLVQGNWLCWPSDDSYYVPGFASTMLAAANKDNLDFVYCDMLYDPRRTGKYEPMPVCPGLGTIDKTCFMLKREWFERIGWPEHEADWRDGALSVAVVAAGARHGKAPGVLVVHN